MLTLSLKMPLGEALAVSVIGLVTVITILAIIACLILLVSKVIRALEATLQKKSAPAETQEKQAAPTAPTASDNSVELIDTDEKTAAVVMAIVAKESGIPLNRLAFKSIRLLEDEKKGEK